MHRIVLYMVAAMLPLFSGCASAPVSGAASAGVIAGSKTNEALRNARTPAAAAPVVPLGMMLQPFPQFEAGLRRDSPTCRIGLVGLRTGSSSSEKRQFDIHFKGLERRLFLRVSDEDTAQQLKPSEPCFRMKAN